MGQRIHVEELVHVDDGVVGALARLLPELSSSAPAPGRSLLERIVDSPVTSLFVARDERAAIVGTLTLAIFEIPTGVRAWIEDVVVDPKARGAGVGTALVAGALEAARSRGARTVDLTSRPQREAANRLYLRCGFELRATNVYRFRESSPAD